MYLILKLSGSFIHSSFYDFDFQASFSYSHYSHFHPSGLFDLSVIEFLNWFSDAHCGLAFASVQVNNITKTKWLQYEYRGCTVVFRSLWLSDFARNGRILTENKSFFVTKFIARRIKLVLKEQQCLTVFLVSTQRRVSKSRSQFHTKILVLGKISVEKSCPKTIVHLLQKSFQYSPSCCFDTCPVSC